MTPRLIRPFSLAAVLAVTVAGCAPRQPELAPERDMSAWTSVIAEATQDVQSGRHAAADRVLLEFQRTHPAAPEAADAAYYRALFKLDPQNSAMSPQEAVALLDGLIATPIINAPVAPRHADAVVLRRVAVSLDTRPVTVVTQPASGGAAAPSAARSDELKAKDDEIAHLRDDLAKANAELERIKRRVATPKP